MSNQSFIDKFYKDKDGKVVIAQKPNLPILVWVASIIITRLSSGEIQSIFSLIGFGALFTWAWLEIFQGDSYFRRALGLVVLVFTIYNRL